VTEINGAEIEAVDVITFGSPCQDLSVAGKRAGLKHSANGDDETTRSGLFMEAVRIIKEMRKATNGKYPKYAIWENVMGAFSSNAGDDFRVVLEELVKICEPEAPPIPSPGKAGWPYADCIMGNGFSLAYRVFDAQYWPGTPQRRKRIYLVLDLTGECAEKILFEREGLRGHSEKSRAPWEGAAGDPQGRSGTDDPESSIIAIDQQGGKGNANYAVDVMPTLCSDSHGTPHAVAYGVTSKGNGDSFISEERHTALSTGGGQPGQGYPCVMQPIAFTQNQRDELRDLGDKAGTIQAAPGTHQQTFIIDNIGGQAEYGVESTVNGTLRAGGLGAICYDARGNGDGKTVNTITGDHNNRITDYSSVVVYNGENITNPTNKANPQPGDPCHTLGTDSRNHLVYCLQGNVIDRANSARCNGEGWKEDVCYTLNTIDRPAVSYSTDVGFFNTCEDVSPTMLARMYKDPHLVCYEEEPQYIVRRLTPTECARLQGFPDRWGDIPHKENLTDEEYSFWLNVRNTHAAINGRTTKEYTKDQILKWYNKLHSDSSEYKMWGNGIALPNALYVMQGIAEAINHGRDRYGEVKQKG